MMTVVRPAAAFLFTLLAAHPAAAQRIDIIDEAKLPRFEVASVKPGDARLDARQISVSPGRLVQENMPLWNAVSLAFDVRPAQLANPLPDLITREPFTIDARLPVGPAAADLRLMLRALLIDRFKLRVHVVSREQDAYALTMARGDGRLGPRLRSSRVDCRARMEAQARNEPVPPLPEGSKPCAFNVGPGSLEMAGWPITTLLSVLSGQAGRPVVDKTGLTGTFDAEMKWAPDTATPRRADDPAATASDATSLVTAVQEELGLKLEPTKTSVDYLVIDHIERPAPD